MSELNINFGDRKIHAFDVDGTLMPGAVVEHAFNKILSDGQIRLTDSEIERILSCKELDNNEYIRQVVQGFSEGTKGLSIKYLRSGLGPTNDISPTNTFHNCGNSSRWCSRRNFSNGVELLQLVFAISCGVFFSVFLLIVRNLRITKGFPLYPMRI